MLEKRRWTQDEIASLINMAGKQPTAKIANLLGRGKTAVAVKAHELKISLRVQPFRSGVAGVDLF